ncbi:MAG: histidine phosphatase family protein, partial [Angustibacter sp.]
HSDIDLDRIGRAQAERAAIELTGLAPNRLVCSDLRRAQDTAAAIARHSGLQAVVDPRLRETFAGGWEGLTAAEIQQAFGDQRAAWRRGELVRPGGTGEYRHEVGDRVAAAVNDHAAGLPEDGLLLVVTHGGAMSAGVPTLLGVPRELWPIMSGVPNCHWTVLQEYQSRWILLEHAAFSLPQPIIGDES